MKYDVPPDVQAAAALANAHEQVGRNMESLQALAEAFLESCPKLEAEVHQALTAGELTQAADRVRDMHSALRIFAVPEILETVASVEQHVIEKDIGAAAESWCHTQNILSALYQRFGRFLTLRS